MGSHHWVMLGLVLVAGYALGRFFPTWGNMVGLP